MTKTEIIAELSKTHSNVKIYANGSIWSNGINLGNVSDYNKPDAERANEQKMMNTGYGLYD